MITRGDGSNCRMCGTFFCRAWKSVSLWLAMFAAVAVNSVALAANATLSFNASCGTKSTSQFTLGSQALTFDRSTIPSWITGLTLHQNIGGMINNTIGLTPATGSWNTSGSSSTCSLDVTVAENTGAARSWTMNILNQSNGSVAWSMLVSQSAGAGGGMPTTYYTVTFNPNGGSVSPETYSVEEHKRIGELPVPTREHFCFEGWFTEADGGERISASTIVTEDVMFYARWTMPYCIVSLDPHGGVVECDTLYYLSGSELGELPTPTRSHYVFLGWRTSPHGGGTLVTQDMIVIENRMLYADWAEAPKVTVEGNGLEIAYYKASNESEFYAFSNYGATYDSTVSFFSSLTPNLVTNTFSMGSYLDFGNSSGTCLFHDMFAEHKTNYFWAFMQGFLCIDETGVYEFGFTADDACVIYIDRQLVYNGEGDGRISLDAGVHEIAIVYWEYTYSQGLTVKMKFPSEPSQRALHQVYLFRPESKVLTFHANGGSVSLESKVVPQGAAVGELPVPVLGGYIFDGWFYSPCGGSPIQSSEMLTADATFYAHWTKLQDGNLPDGVCAISFDANGGCVFPESLAFKTVEKGSGIGVLPVPMRDGFVFAGWFTAPDGGEPVSSSAVVTETQTLYAHWTEVSYDLFIEDNVLKNVTLNGTRNVIIPEGVTGIAVTAFSDCGGLEALTIPSSVEEIVDHTFQACGTINNLTVPVHVFNNSISFGDITQNGWTLQENNRVFCEYKSKYKSNNSTLSLTISGPRKIAFDWKGLCTDADNTTLACSFSIDGAPSGWLYENPNWTTKTYDIPEGEHTLTWNAWNDKIWVRLYSFDIGTARSLFPNCYDKLEKITLTWNVADKIPFGAFAGCVNLTNVSMSGSEMPTTTPGLWQAKFDANNDYSSSILNSPRLARVAGVLMGNASDYAESWSVNTKSFPDPIYGGSHAWNKCNTTFGYCGEMYMEKDKTYVFGKYFEDTVYIKIDGTVVLDNQECDQFATGTFMPLTTGWHEIEVRLADASGKKGPRGAYDTEIKYWSAALGIGWRDDGEDWPYSESDWHVMMDAGDGSLFRHSDQASLIEIFPDSNLERVTVDGCRKIPEKFFVGENTLTEVNISAGVKAFKDVRLQGHDNDSNAVLIFMTETPGRLSFWWKASSESDGDCVFDYAYLSIDDEPLGKLLTDNEEYQLEGVAIGGKTDWRHVELDVTGGGAHTIRWTYCKDEVDEGDTGEDCVWLDDVEFTPLVSVTFDLGDGTGTAPAGFAEMAGTVVTLPDQSGFDLTDYVFEGWSDGTTLYLAGASYTVPYGDVTLTAQWTKKTFLTFDLGGGTGTAPAIVKELRGTVMTLPDQSGFDLTDYVFDGWSDGTTTYASGANYTMPSEDVTLTAQWIKKTFLAFDLGGGTGTAPEVVKELRGTVVALPVQSGFDRADYVFDGWSDGTDTYSAGASYTMPSEDVTLTAQWIEKQFLTFMIDGGEGTVPVTIKDIPGAVVTLPMAEGFSKPKHTFVGWSNGTDTFGAGDPYTVGDGGVEFTAVWQRNETYVVIESSGVVDGGTVDTQGATISMAAWSDPSGGTPAIYYTLDASVPTTNSTRYVAPFVADGLGEVTVKAIAVMDNYFESDVATFTFTRLPYSAAECIGVPAASVTSGGDMPWFRVLGDPAHDGAAAMRSGAIGDSQSSYVEMTVRGSGSVSFWWRVSSQNKVRTNKHDYLSFTIDGIETATLGGGDIDWTNETCSVADNGMHTLRWTYLKDAADAANEDCAWLDDVAWTPDNNDPLPEIGSSAEVALVLAGSTDSRLVAHIATKADYDGFRAWVDEKGLSHKTVMDSRRAWFSYAIGANGLIDRVFGNKDVNIVSIVPMAGGVLTFDAAVAGAPVGAGASPERLASVFAVEGADTLSEEAFSTNSVDVTFAAGLDGRLAVSATPKVSGDAFFMKLKVYPDSDAGNDGGTGSTDSVVTSATVTFDANGGSEVAPVVRMIGSELGELPATAREGHDFGGWFTEPDNGSLVSSSVVVTGDVTYYAHWTEKAGAEGEDALYVDAQAGSDLNTGLSASSAKATIQSAVNAASEGSVIYVAAGTYAPFYTDNKSIRIVGKGGAGVTFVDGGGDYRLANSIHLASGSGGWDNIGNPAQTNTVVEGLTMQNLCTVKGGTIRRCVIRNNDCGNVGGAPVNCSVLENCLITGCRGMNGCASDGCLLRNCTITGNSARDMKYVFLDTIAINCIAYNNVQGSYGLDRRWKTAEHRLVSDAEFWTKNVCTEDPFFVDAANGDYRLREGSPCINAGDNGYVFGTKDLNGDTRIVGGCVDIGCYESDL